MYKSGGQLLLNRRAFTLIELLAVIVILAIIALIAVPIILNIIEDAKKESDERSVELYASAVKNGIASHQLTGSEVPAGSYTLTEDKTSLTNGTVTFKVDYEGNVECTKTEIYADGNIYLEGCTVNGGKETYDYGIYQEDPSCELSDEDSNGKYSVGDIVTCVFEESTEQFYVMENEDEDTTEGIDMLTMYNLDVGKVHDKSTGSWVVSEIENPTGIQSSRAIGCVYGETECYGTVVISSSPYWFGTGISYPGYIYNENSSHYPYVVEYETYLKENEVNVYSSSLISLEQLEKVRYSWDDGSCSNIPDWVVSTSYWTGFAYYDKAIRIDKNDKIDCFSDSGVMDWEGIHYYGGDNWGVRPVITISENELY